MKIEDNIIYIDVILKNKLNKVASDYYFEKLKPENIYGAMSTNDAITVMLKDKFSAVYIRPRKEIPPFDFGHIEFSSEKDITLFLLWIEN